MPITDEEFERWTRRLKADVSKAFGALRDAASIRKIMAAIASGNLGEIAQSIPWEKLNGFSAKLRGDMRDLFEQQAKAEAESIGVSFDVFNPRSVEYAAEFTGRLITVISDETRRGIRSIVQASFESGEGTRWIADNIVESIGLNERQAISLEKYRSRLAADNIKPERIEKLSDRYRQRLLKERAETIARTETIDAAAAGQQNAWTQAVEDRSLSIDKWQVKWSTAATEYCPRCKARDGWRREINGAYQDGVSRPPLHPRCRCVEVLVRRR